MKTNSIPIEAMIVTEPKRLASFVKHFGKNCVAIEAMVYNVAFPL